MMRIFARLARGVVLLLLVVACESSPPAPTAAPAASPTPLALPTTVATAPATTAPSATSAPTARAATPAATTAVSGSGISAADAEKIINDKFNTVDTNLALWNIQPGLGTVMLEYSNRLARMWYAVNAANWDMAKYQHDEMLEIQEVGETTRPGRATDLKNFEDNYLKPLDDAILAKDKTKFTDAFNKAVDGCNACHKTATGTGWKSYQFVHIQTPKTDPASYIDWKGGGQGNLITNPPAAPTAAPPTPLAGILDAAGVQKLLFGKMNTVDTNLSLWNIQPGLGTVMMEYSNRWSRMWYAARAGNWDMAEYQHGEMLEIQEVGETTRPGRASDLKNFENNYLDPVGKAIGAKDLNGFEDAFKKATDGCNACHKTATSADWKSFQFVKVQTPTSDNSDYVLWKASKGTGNAVANAQATATPALPPPPAGSIDANGVTKLISDTFGTANTGLQLWNIQPGLGTVMLEYSNRAARIWYAIEAGNWDMAKYQHDEMLEIQEVGETTRPKRASDLKDFEDNYLKPLDTAILAKDKPKAEDAFKKAIQGCNACHTQATSSDWSSFGFVQMQLPQTDPARFVQWYTPNDTGNYTGTP